MTELEGRLTQLNELIINGNGVKAIELFYADNVIMQENENEPRIGKLACIEQEKQHAKNAIKVTGSLLNQAVDTVKNVIFSEWEIIFVNKAGNTLKLTEVSVQQWENGLVVKEKFYYKDFYPVS